MEHGPMVVTGVLVETDEVGHATHIEKIRITSDE
jgi:calcineurin-like phosphoesterase